MMGRYFNRFKKHLRLEISGIPGGRLKRIFIDVVIKGLLDAFFSLIALPLSKKLDNGYEWRRKGLNEERKKVLNRINDSHFLFHDHLEIAIDLIYLLADNDRPYYGHYQNIKKAFQDMEQLEEIDIVYSNLKDGVNPVNEVEKGHAVIQELCEKHGIENDEIMRRIEDAKKH